MHPAIKVGAILKNKKGDTVEILKTDLESIFPIIALVNNENLAKYTVKGKYFTHKETDNDLNLEPILDLSKPIQCRNGDKAILLEIQNDIIWIATKECNKWETYDYPISGKHGNKAYELINISE